MAFPLLYSFFTCFGISLMALKETQSTDPSHGGSPTGLILFSSATGILKKSLLLHLFWFSCASAINNDNKDRPFVPFVLLWPKYPNAFYARQRSYSTYMLWQFRLSVCLSVRLSVTRVDQSKTVEARITQFSPYSSPIPLVFRG